MGFAARRKIAVLAAQKHSVNTKLRLSRTDQGNYSIIHAIRTVDRLRDFYRSSTGLQKDLIVLERYFSVSFTHTIILKDETTSHFFYIMFNKALFYIHVVTNFIYKPSLYILFYISGYGDIVFDLHLFGRVLIRVQLTLFIF